MHPILFELPGGFPIRSFGVLLAAGFLLGSWIFSRLVARYSRDPERDVALYGALPVWILVGIVLGARAVYVIVEISKGSQGGQEYLNHPLGRVGDVDDIGRALVRPRDGTPVRVLDIADVLIGSAILALPTALDFLEHADGAGLTGVMGRNHALALAARAFLCEDLGLEPPAPTSMLGALVTLPLPAGPPPAGPLDPLHVRLFERYRIEVPVVHFPRPGKRWFRISAQLHNDLDDYRALARALRAEGCGSAT